MDANGLTLAAPGHWRRGEQHGASSTDHDQHQSWSSAVPWPVYSRLDDQSLFPPWRLFEERVRTGPFGLTSFPSQPYSPIRVLVISGGRGGRTSPNLRQFIRINTPPRLRSEWLTSLPQEPEEPSLTNEEFKAAMKKLKKQVYVPHPQTRARRRGLFGGRSSSSSKDLQDGEKDEGKECAICLETFVLNEQVLVTPCNHMFHNDCLVPWIKGHGKCPICRFAFCERRGEASAPNTTSSGEYELALELMALVRAMEEALTWITTR